MVEQWLNNELGRRARAVWAPSVLRRALRHRVTSVLVVAAVAIWIYSAVAQHTAALAAERNAWADQRAVLVVTESVSAGESLMSVVESRDLPAVAIPPQALSQLDPGARASVDLFEGDIVVASRVVGANGSGLAADTVAVTIEVARPVQLVGPGDLVDLWSISAGEAALVVEAVAVLAHEDDTFTLAVPTSAAPVAAAAAFEQLVITRIG